MKCNPQYDIGKPCVYVGMTGLSPDERFDKHKAGIRANRFVREYGLHLLPQIYECFNPMPYDAACRRWKWNWQLPCANRATVSGKPENRRLRKKRSGMSGPDTPAECRQAATGALLAQ